MPNTTCNSTGCDKRVAARGLCSMHYQRVTKSEKPCSIDGCENGNANGSTGYCGTHHNRLMKHGDPMVTMKGKAHKVQYDADGNRICKACGLPKPDTEYHKDKYGSNGLTSNCKPCARSAEKARYNSDPDRFKAEQKARRARKPELAREQDNARYRRDRDKRIELATKHSHIRRARLAKVTSDPGVTRIALRKRDGDKCYYCLRVMDFERAVGRVFHGLHATIEHLQPISEGGSHTFDNCVLACRDCNLSKNSTHIDQFRGFRVEDSNDSGQLPMFALVL